MKRFATLALALLIGGCEILDPPTEFGALRVVVTDSEDQPVPEVRVAIWRDEIRRDCETNADGVCVTVAGEGC